MKTRLPHALPPRHAWYLGVVILCLALIPSATNLALASNSPTDSNALQRGVSAFQAGRFSEAVKAWSLAERHYASVGDISGKIEALMRRAEAYQALGLLNKATDDLQTCRKLAVAAGDDASLARISGLLGSVYLATGRTQEAQHHLQKSLDLAQQRVMPDVVATTLANLGLVSTSLQDPAQALQWLNRSYQIASQISDRDLTAKVQINRVRVAIVAGRYESADEWLNVAALDLAKMVPSSVKARMLVAYADTAHRLQESAGQSILRDSLAVYDSLRLAVELAKRFDDQRTLSFAYGHLGRLYESQMRFSEAMELTREAAWIAQQIGDPAISYQWHWQIGRLLRALDDTNASIEAYRRAIGELKEIRYDLVLAPSAVGGSYLETVRPVVLELADLLLERTKSEGNPEVSQTDLKTVRNTIELIRTVELEDYFRDDCVASLQAKTVGIDQLAGDTAAIYPILLPNRTELILTIGDTLKQVTIPVTRVELTDEVHRFRQRLERVTTRQYLRHAQRLYDWLIRPIESELKSAEITTLVFVPDGPLRTVPLAALHDGERFLIESYATAVVPGLTLLDPKTTQRQGIEVLVNALTEGVQGYTPLPHVAQEVKNIQGLFANRTLMNQEFLLGNVQKELANKPYSVVHIASHGEFNRNAHKSFLLTYDDRLTMDSLEQFIKLSLFRDKPVELLILSACRTAVGDERAALGLAGIGIKAGARSAIASLWFVNDQASADLITEFYQQLKDEAVSKAEALRQGKISLIRNPDYQHPAYWSPFLLVGNWL